MIKRIAKDLSLLAVCLTVASCQTTTVNATNTSANISYKSVFQQFQKQQPNYADYMLLTADNYKKHAEKGIFHIADLNNDGIKDVVLSIGNPKKKKCCSNDERVLIFKGTKNGSFHLVLNNANILDTRGLSSKVTNGTLVIANAYQGAAFGNAPDSFYDIKLKIQANRVIALYVSGSSTWELESGLPTGTDYEYDFVKKTYKEEWAVDDGNANYSVHKASGTFQLKNPNGISFGNNDRYKASLGAPSFINRGIIKNR